MKRAILSFILILILSMGLMACGKSTNTVQTQVTGSAEEATEETASIAESVSVGSSDIEILDADADNTSLSSGTVTVTIGNKQITFSGAYVVDGIDAVVTGGSYETSESDTNVFLVVNGGHLTLSNAEIVKTGDAGTNDSTRTSDVSDDYNFYGINSVILVVGEDSSAEIRDCTITSDCSGANAIFSTAGAEVTAENVEITTTGNSSRGVYATYEGVIDASHMSITTSGAHCAPIATDRGGGYVTVTDSVVNCSGDGSPCIYSTGEIVVENVVGTSTGAQAAVIEGKNSITMTGCSFTVTGSGNNGIMLYQSMSGDAADSDATASVSTLTMTDTTITVDNDGPLLYVTNTASVVNLCGGNTLKSTSGVFASAATGRWGSDGSNGGTLTIHTADSISEALQADDISSITVLTSDGAAVTGSTSGSVTVSEE